MKFTCLTFIFCTLMISHAYAQEMHIIHDGVKRHYLIDLPKNYKNAKKFPVIFVLHGGGGSGKKAKEMTGFYRKAGLNQAIIVYPSGTGKFSTLENLKTWNANHCCHYAMKEKINDVEFIDKLIDELIANQNADPEKIYVTGMSNGGMMANIIGTELSAKVSAIAIVAGGMFGDEKVPDFPVSALIIHGLLDESVPVNGGLGEGRGAHTWDGTPIKPLKYQGQFWSKVNNCKSDSKVTLQNTKITVSEYDCPEGKIVKEILVHNGRHSWPGGEKGARFGSEPSNDLNATDVIWDFFINR